MRMRLLAALASGILLPGGAVLAQSTQSADANWRAIVQCAQRAGAQARHDCIDQVLRDKGVLDSQREITDARRSFGQDRRLETKAVPAPASIPVPAIAPGAAAAVPAPSAPPPSRPAPSAPPELKALQTQIASVRTGADRLFVITTAEGAVWKQTQTIDIRNPPMKGDKIEIEQGALGGHRCKLGGKVFRCQRIG